MVYDALLADVIKQVDQLAEIYQELYEVVIWLKTILTKKKEIGS